jgi:hypothetical protein
MTLDQLYGPYREDIESGLANVETEVFEQAADLVIKVTLDLD